MKQTEIELKIPENLLLFSTFKSLTLINYYQIINKEEKNIKIILD